MLDYQTSGLRKYAVLLLGISASFSLTYLAYWAYLKTKLRDRFRNRATLERVLITAGQLVYLPIALAAVRILACPETGPVGLDFVCEGVSGTCKSEISCSDTWHYIYMVIAAIATLLIVIGMPGVVIWAVHY